MTSQAVTEIQQLNFHGDDISTISAKVFIKQDTMKKAIRSGRIILYRPADQTTTITKSDRTDFDSDQLLGKLVAINLTGFFPVRKAPLRS